jgi:DNA-binding NarL/FixJ family response regulator
MPDIITPTERAAINRFLAAGAVTRVPMGQMATAVEYVWDGSKIVQADGLSQSWRRNRLKFGNRAKKPETTERRDRICALSLQGMKQEDIAAEVGISVRQVKKHVSVLREAGRLPPPDRGKPRRNPERKDQIRQMREAGVMQKDIAAALGVTLSSVKHYVGQIIREHYVGQIIREAA